MKISIVYYAHSLQIYNTIQEHEELELIQAYFTSGVVFNPNRRLIQRASKPMKKCLDIISGGSIDYIVFSKYRKKISSGVLLELHTAKKQGIPLYSLNGEIIEEIEDIPRRKK